MQAAEKFLEPSLSLATITHSACSFIGDPATSRQLFQSSQKLYLELVELRTAVDRMKADGGFSSYLNQPRKQLESAAEKVREVPEAPSALKDTSIRYVNMTY